MQSSPQIRWCIFWGESAPDCPCFYPCFFVWYRKCGCRPGKSTWHSRALAGGSVRGTYCEGSQMAFGSFPYSSPGRWRPWLPHQNPCGAGAVDEKDVPPFPFTGLIAGTELCWGGSWMRYNPRIMMNPVTPVSWVFFGAYALLCLLPVGLEVWTEYRFHRARRMLL